MTLLEVRNLNVGYKLSGSGLFRAAPILPIVHDVSFDLQAGQTLGIVGESGCGKSTLGRALLRLLPAQSGQVIWQGRDLASLSDEEMRKTRSDLQIIFQDPVAALDPRMTLGRIISRPLRTFEPGLGKAELRERTIEMLGLVGLSADFADRYPHELSGGQAQRVGIARALIGKPKLIVCDEPVSALDVSIQAQVINLLMELQERLGLALIFISHNLAVVRHISHAVMVMCLGRVVELSPRDDFYAGPLHPYAQALMESVPDPDPLVRSLRVPVTGELPSVVNPPKGCVFQSRCPKAVERCAQERPELVARGGRLVACHLA